MFSSFRISQEIQATVEAESDLEAGGGEGVIVEKPLLHRPAVYSLFLEYSLSVCVYLGRFKVDAAQFSTFFKSDSVPTFLPSNTIYRRI